MMDEKRREDQARKRAGAWKLMDALQNLPEDLLERSEQCSSRVIDGKEQFGKRLLHKVSRKSWRNLGVACVAVLVLGITAISFRPIEKGGDASGNAMEAADAENRAPEVEEALTEKWTELDGAMNGSTLTDTIDPAVKVESATMEEAEEQPWLEALEQVESDALSDRLAMLHLPEGYTYTGISVENKTEQESVKLSLSYENVSCTDLTIFYPEDVKEPGQTNGTDEVEEPGQANGTEEQKQGNDSGNVSIEGASGNGAKDELGTVVAGVTGVVSSENLTLQWCREVIEESGIGEEDGLFIMEVCYPDGVEMSMFPLCKFL